MLECLYYMSILAHFYAVSKVFCVIGGGNVWFGGGIEIVIFLIKIANAI